MSLRVGIIFEHFGPYHVARLRGASPYVDVVPIELFSRCDRYAWSELGDELDIQRDILFEGREPGSVDRTELRHSLIKLLSGLNLDVLTVHGWSLPGSTAAIQWAASQHIPVVVMSESKRDDHHRRWSKERVKKAILGCVSAGLVGADLHSDYLVGLGLPADSIFSGYDAVDNKYFKEGARNAITNDSQLRRQHSLPENFFFSSNRFIEKKNLERLIVAFSRYVQEVDQPWSLVMAGDGPLRDRLERLVESLGLQERVHFAGFLQYEDLPVYYGLASAFVHVSTTEQWGLVVNEAAAAGLPLIVSGACGCTPHLVCDMQLETLKETQNGFICNAESVDSIEQSLIRMSSLSETERKMMSRRSVEIVAGYGPDQFGLGLRAAARYAMKNRRRGSTLDGVLMSMMKAFNS